jgi:hypothetical protein
MQPIMQWFLSVKTIAIEKIVHSNTMAEVFVASVVSPVKILLCNTAVECDPTFSFLQLFQLLQKRQSDSSDSIRSLNYDNISSIRIKEHPKETEGIEMTIDMQLKLCKDFNCKYIEYRVNVSQKF